MIAFLDEVNTCNCMGLFKEIVADRAMNGVPLPPNLEIIAACNPYRKKRGIAAEQARVSSQLPSGLFSSLLQQNELFNSFVKCARY
jgi:hypothetical protein